MTTSLLLSACGDQNIRPSESTATTGPTDIKTIVITEADRDQYRLAITALSQNQLEEAEQRLKDFIKQRPELAGAYTNLGLVYYQKEQPELAIKMVEEAIKLNPGQAEAYHLRGQLLVKQGKIHEAREDYMKALELNPDYSNAHYNLALLYDIYLQDIAQALKHYEQYMALSKQPDEKIREWISHLKGSMNNG